MLIKYNRKFRIKLLLLGVLTLLAIVRVLMLKPIPQDPSFHIFADHRSLWGISNFFNVISNFPFLLVSVAGLYQVKKAAPGKGISITYIIIFAGILLTGLGSAHYHLAPDNNTLVWDRLPMTIVFTALLSATVSEFLHYKAGIVILPILLIAGVSSVLWWHYTELQGAGDLRFYGLIQFYPMIIIPIIVICFPSPRYKGSIQLLWVILWYAVAKLFEHFDLGIYSLTHWISGHTLKHLAAAMATWYLVRLFQKRHLATKTKV